MADHSPQDEVLDIVDHEDRVIGQTTRRDLHLRRLNHRAVHLFLFNADNQLFIQKRSQTKDSFPGCYDSSASGHVDRGETYNTCAVRELHEELRDSRGERILIFEVTWIHNSQDGFSRGTRVLGSFFVIVQLVTQFDFRPMRRV